MLPDRGIVTKTDDPTHKQKAIYALTEQGIELLPTRGENVNLVRGDLGGHH
jgi:DNA-binding HxlR family transcriptional regulator